MDFAFHMVNVSSIGSIQTPPQHVTLSPASFVSMLSLTVFLLNLSYRYVGINATDINYSAGRYHRGQSPPFDAGLEVNVL